MLNWPTDQIPRLWKTRIALQPENPIIHITSVNLQVWGHARILCSYCGFPVLAFEQNATEISNVKPPSNIARCFDAFY